MHCLNDTPFPFLFAIRVSHIFILNSLFFICNVHYMYTEVIPVSKDQTFNGDLTNLQN